MSCDSAGTLSLLELVKLFIGPEEQMSRLSTLSSDEYGLIYHKVLYIDTNLSGGYRVYGIL